MFKTIALSVLGVLVVAAAVVLVLAARKPDVFRVEREAAIKAPPEKIFPMIADFRAWSGWSPYDKLDPGMKRTYGGAPAGKGATYAWEGNGKAGAGRMEITDAPAPSKVQIKLDFSKPFEAHNTATFALEPKGDTTNVRWSMEGPSPFIAKVMGVFFDMDRMIGKDFETGLANLKTAAEQ